MNTHPHPQKYALLSLIALLLASMACMINLDEDGGKELSVQQTLVSIQQTQNALNAPSSQEEEIPEVLPEPTITLPEVLPEPTITPTIEQPDVIYEGISFSFNPGIAASISPSTIPAQNMGEESMPGDTYPTHFVFEFNAYAVSDHFHTPKIIIYPVNDYQVLSEYAGDIIDNLKQTLITRPGGGSISHLPFLPMWNAAQLFSASVSYFDFENGSGVRFLTMYGQAIYPVDNTNLFYTYQGLTNDGEYYISAVLPVTNPGLPDEGQIDDYLAFEENWETYLADTIAWLQAQDPQNFSPSLDMLDAMMASYEINR